MLISGRRKPARVQAARHQERMFRERNTHWKEIQNELSNYSAQDPRGQ